VATWRLLTVFDGAPGVPVPRESTHRNVLSDPGSQLPESSILGLGVRYHKLLSSGVGFESSTKRRAPSDEGALLFGWE